LRGSDQIFSYNAILQLGSAGRRIICHYLRTVVAKQIDRYSDQGIDAT